MSNSKGQLTAEMLEAAKTKILAEGRRPPDIILSPLWYDRVSEMVRNGFCKAHVISGNDACALIWELYVSKGKKGTL